MTDNFIFVVLQLDNGRFLSAFSTLADAKEWALAEANNRFFPSIDDRVGEDGGEIFCTGFWDHEGLEICDADFEIKKVKIS